MTERDRCLQQRTGSCLGCNILDLIANRANHGQGLDQASTRFQGEYCPPDARPQTSLIRSKMSAGMGQQASTLVEVRP